MTVKISKWQVHNETSHIFQLHRQRVHIICDSVIRGPKRGFVKEAVLGKKQLTLIDFKYVDDGI